MDPGDMRAIEMGQCRDLYLIETGMFDVTGYGAVYVIDAEQPAIIESGLGRHPERITHAVDSLGIDSEELAVIALSHVHLDHAGGAGHLANRYPNAEVVIHERGAPHLADPTRLIEGTKRAVGDQWRYYGQPEPVAEDRIRAVSTGDTIDLGDHELQVRSAPGHAPHQVIFHIPTMAAVMTGDAAGIWVSDTETLLHTSPPPNFDLEQSVADLAEIAACEPETLLYPHFGPMAYDDTFPATYETILQGWVATVAEKRDALGDDEAVIEALVAEAPMAAQWSQEKAEAEARINVEGVLTYLDRQA